MKITAIKQAVKTPGRFNVSVDGKYSFSLDELQVINTGIKTGNEYSESELEKLKDESAFGKAYARALDYIMRRPRSEKEMRDYAWRKKWEPAMAGRVMNQLRDKGYLNDQKFAEFWIRNRALGKPMSVKKLRLELMQKGVSGEIIENALSKDEEFDEQTALKRMIEKKRGRYDDEQKLIAYLLRQGFRYDDIKEVLSSL